MEFIHLRKHLQEKGLVSSLCREVKPYYYSRNGGQCRERSAGWVALEIRSLAEKHGICEKHSIKYPIADWCGSWPRTVRSWNAEQTGTFNFWYLVEQLEEKGIL